VSNAPTPARESGWAAAVAVTMTATPAVMTITLATSLLLDAAVLSTAELRSAASGETRDARTAGTKLASKVEPIQTTSATTIVVEDMMTPSKPRSKPALSMTDLSATARP
jgi:hypothetical protein